MIVQQELVVRVCFILGNLTSKSEKVREAIFSDESFMEVLVSVMQTYFNLEMEVCGVLVDDSTLAYSLSAKFSREFWYSFYNHTGRGFCPNKREKIFHVKNS